MAPHRKLAEQYGPWAVVSGASSGIGAAFARQLAAAGLSVVLIARRAERLERLSSELRAEFEGIQTKVIAQDLTAEDATSNILSEISSLDVGLLINNAGAETKGNFLSENAERHSNMLKLNVVAFTEVCHGFGRKLVQRTRADADGSRRAGMIMLSSMANIASPYMASYTASKGYVSELGVALRHEWEGDRVDVMVLEPGYIKTEMSERLVGEVDMDKMGMEAMLPEHLVRDALAAFLKGNVRCTPGFKNSLSKIVLSWMPESMRVVLSGKMFRNAARDPKLVEYTPA